MSVAQGHRVFRRIFWSRKETPVEEPAPIEPSKISDFTFEILDLLNVERWLSPLRIHIRDSAPLLSEAILLAIEKLDELRDLSFCLSNRSSTGQLEIFTRKAQKNQEEVSEAFYRAHAEVPYEDEDLLSKLFEEQLQLLLQEL